MTMVELLALVDTNPICAASCTLETTKPMDWDTFTQLWDHPIEQSQRNWVPGYAEYRDALSYLLHLRHPHVARMAIPDHLQTLLIATFLQVPGTQMWLHEEHPDSGYVVLTIWLPTPPPTLV